MPVVAHVHFHKYKKLEDYLTTYFQDKIQLFNLEKLFIPIFLILLLID